MGQDKTYGKALESAPLALMMACKCHYRRRFDVGREGGTETMLATSGINRLERGQEVNLGGYPKESR